MKLGNYFQQTVPVKRKHDSAIIVTNDRIKKEFEEKLQNKEAEFKILQQSLMKTKEQAEQHITLYNDVTKRHLEALETIRTHEEAEAQVFALKRKLGVVQQEADKVGNLEQRVIKTTDSLKNSQEEYYRTGRQLELTAKELKESQDIIKDLKEDKHKVDVVVWDYESKYPVVVSEYENSKNELEVAQNKINQQTEDVEMLTANFFYWKDAAADLRNQLDGEAKLRDEIKRSLEILAQETRMDSKTINKSSKAYKKAKEEILALTKHNLELTNFTEQMSKIITGQKKAIASMGLSQAAIGSKEEFHIPFAKENIRTKQLGNAQPTLLKFKETIDDNN